MSTLGAAQHYLQQNRKLDYDVAAAAVDDDLAIDDDVSVVADDDADAVATNEGDLPVMLLRIYKTSCH